MNGFDSRAATLRDAKVPTTIAPVEILRDSWAKRALDLSVAATTLVLLSPLFVTCAILARTQSRGTTFFLGPRVGRGGRPFRLVKFRTMILDAPKQGPGITTSNDPRVTRIGRFLRLTKLDELPNMLNVLNGTMSLVGPRPELPIYVAHYTEEQRRVLRVRPGITGPTQLRFSNEEELLAREADPESYYMTTLIPEKVAMDLDYIDGRTFWGDVALLLRTAALVLRRAFSLILHRRKETQV